MRVLSRRHRRFRSLALFAVLGLGAVFACSSSSEDPEIPAIDGGGGVVRADATTDAGPSADSAGGDATVAPDVTSTDGSPGGDATADAGADATTDADVDAEADGAADADVDAGDACAPGTPFSCDLDSGLETRCAADGGVEAVPCSEGCHPDAGRCIAPLAVDAGPDPVVALDASTTLSAFVTGGVGPYTYAWSPATALDDAASPQPVVTPTSTTPYTITVTDIRATTATDSVLVKVPDAPLALSRWTVINYPGTQGTANWTFLDAGTTSVQTVNADPSLLVADFELTAGFEVTGRFAVTNAAADDDFIGFAFGLQDARHYYLFDWKRTAQANGTCGTAARGMSLRKIDADVDPTCLTLWGTTGSDAGATTLSPASLNDVAWVAGTFYDFKLSHSPAGLISIEVRNSATQALVGSVSVTDTTWLKGRFAFYNYSQANGRYEFFRARDLP